MRKAGLWEMKMVRTGRADARDDHAALHRRDHRQGDEHAFSPMAKQICAKQDIQKTATGYVSDSVCSVAGMTHHLACRDHRRLQFGLYGEDVVARARRRRRRARRDTTMQLEAKWLGACKPDQKPGDIVMPGGFKMNIRTWTSSRR